MDLWRVRDFTRFRFNHPAQPVRSFLASNVNQMAISKMRIWRIYSTMRAFIIIVSEIMMLINMFRTEHPAAAFGARGTPGVYTFPCIIVVWV